MNEKQFPPALMEKAEALLSELESGLLAVASSVKMHTSFGSSLRADIVEPRLGVLMDVVVQLRELFDVPSHEEEGMQTQKEQPQAIDGIVLIVVAKGDFDRVLNQLKTKVSSVDPSHFAGPLFSMRATPWERFTTQAFFYLELVSGEWGNVVHWCESAYRVGLVQSYHSAQVGPLKIVSQEGQKRDGEVHE